MKKILITLIAALSVFTSCDPDKELIRFKLDEPFVFIQDDKGMGQKNIDSKSNNYAVSVYINYHGRNLKEDLKVQYRCIVGDGLKEGVDFKMKQALEGEVVITQAIQSQPLQIVFLRHDIDPAKDNTLAIELVSSSDPGVTLGYLSLTENHLYKKFIFKKIITD